MFPNRNNVAEVLELFARKLREGVTERHSLSMRTDVGSFTLASWGDEDRMTVTITADTTYAGSMQNMVSEIRIDGKVLK